MRLKTAALTGVLLAADAASGATVYTSQGAFVSQVGSGVGPAADFNDLALTASRGPVTGAFNDFAYSVGVAGVSGGTGLGVMAYDASQADRFLVANLTSHPQMFGLRVSFTGLAPVTAVGANLFRYQQADMANPSGVVMGGNMSVRLYDMAGNEIHAMNFASAGRDSFIAFTSEVAIGSMVIQSVASYSYAGMDNLYYGTAMVPLPPASWAGLGLLGVIGGVRAMRRRG